jgi:hypothetical protein
MDVNVILFSNEKALRYIVVLVGSSFWLLLVLVPTPIIECLEYLFEILKEKFQSKN